MKIAVPFENGEVFQHFGHTEHFKLYEIEAGRVVSSEVIDTNGSGHEALADFLADRFVDVLLCGGIGDGAQAALAGAGDLLGQQIVQHCDEKRNTGADGGVDQRQLPGIVGCGTQCLCRMGFHIMAI